MPVRARLFLVASPVVAAFAAVALAGCPTPQSPKGPPPEYEEPAAPSWLRDGGTGDGAAAADAADAAG